MWSDDGTSFRVCNTEQFSRDILPLYFKHNNYASFVRQLNMYGFHRSTEPRTRIEPGIPMVENFMHEMFQRGREDLITNITRKTSSTTGRSRSTKSPASSTAVTSSAMAQASAEMASMHEKIDQLAAMEKDVEILKSNQMQLAHTIQVLSAANKRLSDEKAASDAQLEQVIQLLQTSGIAGAQQLGTVSPAVIERRLRSDEMPPSFPDLTTEVYDLTGNDMDIEGVDLDQLLSSGGVESWPEAF